MNVDVKVRTVRRFGGHIGIASFIARDEHTDKVLARGEFETPICATPDRAKERAEQEADLFLSEVCRNG